MRRWLLGACLFLTAACAGGHNGYPSKAPWKKATRIELVGASTRLEAEVDFANKRRARWFALELDEPGRLDIGLELLAGPDDDDFDLGVEVLDPAARVIARQAAHDDQAKAHNKTLAVDAVATGRYLVHVFLQRRTDAAEFALTVRVTRGSGRAREVLMPPRLAVVPLVDDTPDDVPPPPRPKKITPAPVPVAQPTLTAKIINVAIGKGGTTTITINRGTNHGADAGMRGRVLGVKGGDFSLSSCGTTTCRASVKATPDELQRASKVELTP